MTPSSRRAWVVSGRAPGRAWGTAGSWEMTEEKARTKWIALLVVVGIALSLPGGEPANDVVEDRREENAEDGHTQHPAEHG